MEKPSGEGVGVEGESSRKEQVSDTLGFDKAVQGCASLLVIEAAVSKGAFYKKEIVIREIACSLIAAISEWLTVKWWFVSWFLEERDRHGL